MLSNRSIKTIVIWFCLWLYFYFFGTIVSIPIFRLYFSLFFFSSILLTYHLLSYFTQQNIEKKRYVVIVLIFLLAFAFQFSLDYFNFKLVFPSLNLPTARDGISMVAFVKRTLYWYLLIAIIVYYNLRLKINLINTESIAKYEGIRLNHELLVLRNQFHSHLNFNFLNFCYLELINVSESVAEAVEHYSQMLRYTLVCNKLQWISLEQEVTYMKHFIALQNYLTTKVYCELKVDIDRNNYKIAPMLFGIILEYVFRRGVLNNSEFPLCFEILAQNKCIAFTSTYVETNQILVKESDDSLSYIEETLELLYPSRSEFRVESIDNLVHVNLKIDLDA